MAAPNRLAPNSRVNRGQKGFGIVLPASCDLPVPKLPKGREWSRIERNRWRELWKSPQANMWDDSASGMVAMLIVLEQSVFSDAANAWKAQEARHISDGLGLTPKSMAALGWKVEDPDE